MSGEFVHRSVAAEQDGLPTLLLLHGTGGNEDDLLGLGRELLPGAALLSPRGKVLENGMPRFFRRLREGVFDLDDLRKRTQELADWVKAQSNGPVIAVGYSNGANIAAAMLLLRPEVLSGAVLLRAMVPLEPESAPDLSGKSVWLAAGRRDPIVRPENTEALAGLLRRFGAQVELTWADSGHELTRAELNAAAHWLQALTNAPLSSSASWR